MGRTFLINSTSCWIGNSVDNFQLKNWIFLSYHTVVYWLFPTPQVILLLILLYYLIKKLTVELLKLYGNHRSINEQFDLKIRKFLSFRNFFMFTLLKFIYSEKVTKFFKTSTIDLTVTTWDKSTVEISQNFVDFSKYMNFNSNSYDFRKNFYPNVAH